MAWAHTLKYRTLTVGQCNLIQYMSSDLALCFNTEHGFALLYILTLNMDLHYILTLDMSLLYILTLNMALLYMWDS